MKLRYTPPTKLKDVWVVLVTSPVCMEFTNIFVKPTHEEIAAAVQAKVEERRKEKVIA